MAKVHDPIPDINNCPGFLLEDFDNDEINKVLPIYKNIFQFKGDISPSVSNALRNGFFLRIFGEVYSQKTIPQEINDRELIRRYLKQSLEKTILEFEVGLRVLSKIGEILIGHKYSSREAYKDNGLEVESLVKKLELTLEATIPEDLFTRNILIKSNRDDSYNVSFYYSKIRDYIICFQFLKLDQLSDDEFYDVLESLYENYIGQSALDLVKGHI